MGFHQALAGRCRFRDVDVHVVHRIEGVAPGLQVRLGQGDQFFDPRPDIFRQETAFLVILGNITYEHEDSS